MALPYYFTGTFTRSGGLLPAIGKQTKLLNLKTTKKITFSFDPLGEKALVLRQTLNYFYQARVRNTNPKCVYKTVTVNDRSMPLIEVESDNNSIIRFELENLETLDILCKFNELVSSQVPVEEEPEIIQTKSQSKQGMKRR